MSIEMTNNGPKIRDNKTYKPSDEKIEGVWVDASNNAQGITLADGGYFKVQLQGSFPGKGHRTAEVSTFQLQQSTGKDSHSHFGKDENLRGIEQRGNETTALYFNPVGGADLVTVPTRDLKKALKQVKLLGII